MNLKLSNTNKILLGIATVIIVGALITFCYVSSHTSHVAEGEYYLYGTMIDSNTTYRCLVLKNDSSSIPDEESPFYIIKTDDNTIIKDVTGENSTIYALKDGMKLQVTAEKNSTPEDTQTASIIQVQPS